MRQYHFLLDKHETVSFFVGQTLDSIIICWTNMRQYHFLLDKHETVSFFVGQT